MTGPGARPPHDLSGRRKVLAGLAGAIGAALAAWTLWPMWRFLSPEKRKDGTGQVTVAREKIPVGGAHLFHFQGNPAILMQPSPGTFVALSAVCTHLGCIVNWRPEERILFCPCHAGRFSPTGEVLGGPPPKPLPQYAVEVGEEQVVIREGKA